jgi:hypothetical protein
MSNNWGLLATVLAILEAAELWKKIPSNHDNYRKLILDVDWQFVLNLLRNTTEIPLTELKKKNHRHISQMGNVRDNYCEFGSSGSGSQPATCRRRVVCVVYLGSFIQSGVSRGGRVIKKLLYWVVLIK